MSEKLLTDLAWKTAQTANKAHSEFVEAQGDNEAYNRLTKLNLPAVPVDESVGVELKKRADQAKNQFLKILEVSSVLDIKTIDPNPTPNERPIDRLNIPLDIKLQEKETVIPLVEQGGRLAIRKEGFVNMASAAVDSRGDVANQAKIKANIEYSTGGRIFNSMMRVFIGYPKDNPIAGWIGEDSETSVGQRVAVLYADRLPELKEKINSGELQPSSIPNFGDKSLAVLMSVIELWEQISDSEQ